MNRVNEINKEWHLAHRMPKNPSEQQRLEWHIAHAKHCHCREIPALLKVELRKRNIRIK
jgi:hypothetical protein